MKSVLQLVPKLMSNYLTAAGSVVTTLSALGLIATLVSANTAADGNAYGDALVVVALLVAFALGLAAIPLGLAWERRRRRKSGLTDEDPFQAAFSLAFEDKRTRRRILFVVLLTVGNAILFGAAGQRTVAYLDSPTFCGTTCHDVMQPEWVAYQQSSHSRVACVACHIGPGASFAVKAKVDGLRQVYGVLVDDYHRPIETPVETLRPSRDTCEQCHWPAKFHGSRVALRPHYSRDEENSPAFNAVLLKVGGPNPKSGEHEGIHWHVSPDTQVFYESTDAKREHITKVTVQRHGETVAEFVRPDAPADDREAPPTRPARLMDCIDCHNRPTHGFDLSTELAVDRGLYEGVLDTAVPHLASVATSVLGRADVDREQAEPTFRRLVEEAYARDHPDAMPAPEALDAAATGLAALYQRNIFPAMNVGWGTYQSHLGHGDPDDGARGCFRCHDDVLEATLPGGETRTLAQDCDLCHELLAEEAAPSEFDATLQALLGGGVAR